jgi:hypothetical protein
MAEMLLLARGYEMGRRDFGVRLFDRFSVYEGVRAVCLVLWPSLGGSRDEDKKTRESLVQASA